MDSNDLEKERGITVARQMHERRWRRTRITSSARPVTPISAPRSSGSCRWSTLSCSSALPRVPCRGPVRHRRALALGLKPIVVVNGSTAPTRAPAEVLDEVFELFLNLEASDSGSISRTTPAVAPAMRVPPTTCRNGRPHAVVRGPYVSLVRRRGSTPARSACSPTCSTATRSSGRSSPAGSRAAGSPADVPIKALDVNGDVVEEGRATRGLHFPRPRARARRQRRAAEIVAIAGLVEATVPTPSPTRRSAFPLHARPIDPPTLAMSFSVERQPFAAATATGAEPGHPQRLGAEAEGNVAIRVTMAAATTASRSPDAAAPARRADRGPAPRRLRARHQPPTRPLSRRANGREEPYETDHRRHQRRVSAPSSTRWRCARRT